VLGLQQSAGNARVTRALNLRRLARCPDGSCGGACECPDEQRDDDPDIALRRALAKTAAARVARLTGDDFTTGVFGPPEGQGGDDLMSGVFGPPEGQGGDDLMTGVFGPPEAQGGGGGSAAGAGPLGSPAPAASGGAAGCIVEPPRVIGGTNTHIVLFQRDSTDYAPGQFATGASVMESPTIAAQVRGAAKIELFGNASPEGDKAHNLDLACRRARRVATDLVTAGITVPITVFSHGGADEFSAHDPANRPPNRNVEMVFTPAPAPTPPPAPTPAPPVVTPLPAHLKFWLNAFIANSMPGARPAPAGPFKGRQVFKGPTLPFHHNSCFETDERSFTSRLPASSRLHLFLDFDTATKRVSSLASADPTFEIDCATGAIKCGPKLPTPSTAVSTVPPLFGSSRFDIVFSASDNDPCVFGSPDIALRGILTIDLTARTFSFSVTITLFPWIEMYADVGSGPPVTLFNDSPPVPSVGMLFVPSLAVRRGSGTF
jgi:outer membrane protein OmpA-like peptidoglycan-associated protein